MTGFVEHSRRVCGVKESRIVQVAYSLQLSRIKSVPLAVEYLEEKLGVKKSKLYKTKVEKVVFENICSKYCSFGFTVYGMYDLQTFSHLQ